MATLFSLLGSLKATGASDHWWLMRATEGEKRAKEGGKKEEKIGI